MTFLIDPPLLIIFSMTSVRIGIALKDNTVKPLGPIIAILSLCVIIFTSTSLYINGWWMDWFWIPLQPAVTSGRDLMINSGIFSFESENTAGLIDLLAALQVMLYPLWTYIGLRIYGKLWSQKE